MKKILMVCLGNICRSPMAEGMMRQKAEKRGLELQVDSAGFEPYHEGERPDSRAIQTMKAHGYDITNIRSRVFSSSDLRHFDHIYVMDDRNYQDVVSMIHASSDREKVDYISNVIHPGKNVSVPDPYMGGVEGFETTFQLLDQATDGILERLLKESTDAS